MKVLLASRNPGKLREFAELLPWELLPWPAGAPEIPETGAFFRDNALQKAAFARKWWLDHGGIPVQAVLADDSGLCVDALWGGPGVLSARFAPGVPPRERNLRLLELVPADAARSARFVCVLALLPCPEGRALLAEGSVEGRLAESNRGGEGFGYDPIFLPAGHDRTFGELPAAEKHALSHRGRAARALLEALR